ncbi:hypothetical protein DYB26_014083 [Aphanomyces astaci]|uniref:Uncharacterized protein n=1 Tax=Aphanomyces astaci TaxID=112090 RepID=A0A3R6WS89_APHAT|nr:hypothetical protein DYB26_014083 [Aphanomyces astaci]
MYSDSDGIIRMLLALDLNNDGNMTVYEAPEWALNGSNRFGLSMEVIKGGIILEKVELVTSSKSYFVAGQLFLVDLGSTHGTFVNKKRISAADHVELHVGDVVVFGESTRIYTILGPVDLMPDEYSYFPSPDPEDSWFASEVALVDAAVRRHDGLSVVVIADWFNPGLVRHHMSFWDATTLSTWQPVTGGANVPAINTLLAGFGVGLSSHVWSNVELLYLSGSALIDLPDPSFVLYANLTQDTNKKEDDRGVSMGLFKQDMKEMAIAAMVQIQGGGRIVVYGDSSCVDSSTVSQMEHGTVSMCLVALTDKENEGRRILQDGINIRASGEKLLAEGDAVMALVDKYREGRKQQLNLTLLGFKKIQELRHNMEVGDDKIKRV